MKYSCKGVKDKNRHNNRIYKKKKKKKKRSGQAWLVYVFDITI